MNTTAVDNTQDFINSRDIIERIAELRDEWAEATGDDPDDYQLSEDDWAVGLGEEGAHELVSLMEFADELSPYLPDWEYGEELIRDTYFTEYAQEMAESIGTISSDAQWPLSYIDWERAADELKLDYTCAELDGVTYWGRM